MNCSSSRCDGAIFAVDRPHAADVAGVVAIIGSVIHQHEVAVLEGRRVAEVVHVVDVLGAAGGDGAIAFEAGVVGDEDEMGGRVELVFGHARFGAAHGLDKGEARDLGGSADQRDLARALDAAHFVEHGIEIADLRARLPHAQELDEPLLARRRAVPEIVRARGFCRDQLTAALSQVFRRTELRVDRRRRLAAPAASGPAGATSGQFWTAVSLTALTSLTPVMRFTSSASSATERAPRPLRASRCAPADRA